MNMQTTESNSEALLKAVRQTGTEAWYFSQVFAPKYSLPVQRWQQAYPESAQYLKK